MKGVNDNLPVRKEKYLWRGVAIAVGVAALGVVEAVAPGVAARCGEAVGAVLRLFGW